MSYPQMWISALRFVKHNAEGDFGKGGHMFKVNIYIETDGQDKRKRYRTFAAIVEFTTRHNKPVIRKTHGTENTTGNGIMLYALAASLRILTKPCEIKIYMDCDYVSDNICSGRVYEWFSNGWKTLRGEPVRNREEWREVMGLLKGHDPVFTKENHEYKTELHNDIQDIKNRGMEYRQQTMEGGVMN